MSDKGRLVNEVDEAFMDLRQAFDGLDDARLHRVWLGTWSIREILIHISGWHREMLPALARVAHGEPAYPAGTYDDFDTWNARFVEAKRSARVADVVAELEASHRDFLRAVGAVPDAHFAVAREILDGAGTGHYREHAEQIRVWRQKEAA